MFTGKKSLWHKRVDFDGIEIIKRGEWIENMDRWITPETREKQRVKAAGRKKSPEERMKISMALKGRPKSEQTRFRMKKAHWGYKHPPEVIEKIRATAKRNAANRPPMTLLTRLKLNEGIREYYRKKKLENERRKEYERWKR